jgi:palmitoyltransferase ZDHHC13/17
MSIEEVDGVHEEPASPIHDEKLVESASSEDESVPIGSPDSILVVESKLEEVHAIDLCDAVQEPAGTDWFHLARSGDFPTILKHASDDTSLWPTLIACRDDDGHTLLHWSCLLGSYDFVHRSGEYLRDPEMKSVSAWVNTRSHNGQTAFMWATLKGNVPIMKLLFHRFGAEIILFDSLRANSAILAVQHHQHNAMLLLHRWSGNRDGRNIFDHTDSSGCSAVHWAAYKGDTLALRLLEYFGADMNPVDNQGMTPLHRATSEGWNEAALFLVERGRADLDLKNGKQESAIEIAKRLDNFALLARFDDVIQKQKNASSPNLMGWILPAVFCVCMSLVVICYLGDFAGRGFGYSGGLFVLCAVISISIFSWLVTSDPGIVPRRLVGTSALEELELKLDDEPSGGKFLPVPSSVSVQRICFTCWEWKGLRTKHCSVCDVCVSEFDHHCAWVNTCIAERNHRQFVLMVGCVWAGMTAFLIATISDIIENRDRYESIWDFLSIHPLIVPSWFIHLMVLPWVTILFFHQLRSIALNLNTNEMINMHRYAHFWEDPLGEETAHADTTCSDPTHAHHKEPRFNNPFDKGSKWDNCVHFWTRKSGYQIVTNGDIELADMAAEV